MEKYIILLLLINLFFTVRTLFKVKKIKNIDKANTVIIENQRLISIHQIKILNKLKNEKQPILFKDE